MSLDFLKSLHPDNQVSDITASTGEGFQPSGFIGQTYATPAFKVFTAENIKDFEDIPIPQLQNYVGGYHSYYYVSKADAQAAMEMMNVQGFEGRDPVAKQTWVVAVKRDTVKNFADSDALAKWSETILGDGEITATFKSKYRHVFHGIQLPLAVQAVAKAFGFTYEPFDYSELTGREIIYTDEFYAKLFGEDTKNPKTFLDSVFGARRAKLWASLGETNPLAWQPIGTKNAKGELSSFATTSNLLSQCLNLIYTPWEQWLWTRMMNVSDPRVDAIAKSGNRLPIPCIVELFNGEKQAQVAANKDLERFKNKDDASASNGSTAEVVKTPDAWAGLDAEWAAKVAELRQANKPSAPALAKLAKELDVTVADLNGVWA